MRSLWLGAFLCAAMLVACSDDDSDFLISPSKESSSSAKSCSSAKSSTKSSSSSAKSSSSDESSSSYEESSSSAESSSSLAVRQQCNVKTVENCFMDERDGQTYRTVKIGNKLWMAENLAYGIYTDTSLCPYYDKLNDCVKYGGLYYWEKAMESCPFGWHLPDSTEWEELFKTVGKRSEAAKVLRSKTDWLFEKNGTDDFGFSALPAGSRSGSGRYSGFGDVAAFWAYDKWVYQKDWSLSVWLYRDDDTPDIGSVFNAYDLSVRCIRDEDYFKREQCDVETDELCFMDERDGRTYRTTKIGDQVWMAENLNYDTYRDYCYLGTISNCERFGMRYRWAAAIDEDERTCGPNKDCPLRSGNIQGVCPNGWHLPDSTEWVVLINTVKADSASGENALMSASGWNAGSLFELLQPNGYRYFGRMRFWSSTEYWAGWDRVVDNSYGMDLDNLGRPSVNLFNKGDSLFVRCIQD